MARLPNLSELSFRVFGSNTMTASVGNLKVPDWKTSHPFFTLQNSKLIRLHLIYNFKKFL